MNKILLLIFAMAVAANAQVNKPSKELTGVLSHDLFASAPSMSHEDSLAMFETRSALKAGLFSLIIPGAGQAYNKNYLKAAAFFAVEVAGWVVDVVWTNKGNEKTNFFQTYADGTAAANYTNEHWSVVQYATWIQKNLAQLEQINQSPDPATANQYAPLMVVNTGGPAPWNKVNWSYLNKVEGALGGYFSHLLPIHGNQQYYELIGKYPQFRQGWDDENPTFVNFQDLERDTPHSGYYMDQRGQANYLYAVASTAVGVVLVNHFVSAIEAALWAHSHNKFVQTSVGMSPLPQGMGYQTEVNLALHF
ncbi:MAG: DUF5683 domain-containing protein [Bacteroidetes bacterium]|nr:DUF5683 domain-containing protein [Bacteroidota bacterium]